MVSFVWSSVSPMFQFLGVALGGILEIACSCELGIFIETSGQVSGICCSEIFAFVVII